MKLPKGIYRLARSRRRLMVIVAAILIALAAATGMVYLLKQVNHVTPRPNFTRSTQATSQSAVSDATVPKSNAPAVYTVAPFRPRTLSIPKISVDTDVLPMGLTKDGAIDVPSSIDQVGWYTGSSLPGKKGAVIIDGHASQTGSYFGIFSHIASLTNGDTLDIETGDHQHFIYTVVHVETDDLKNIDMERFLQPYESAEQGLNLITCTGDWIGTGTDRTLDKRVLVFAVRTNG